MLVNNPSCFSKCFKISYVLKIQIGNIIPVPRHLGRWRPVAMEAPKGMGSKQRQNRGDSRDLNPGPRLHSE